MSTHVYIAPRRLPARQRKALIFAHSTLVCWAKGLSEGPCQREIIARDLAEQARGLVAAFGVRVDGRRTSPFPHQLPEKTQSGRTLAASEPLHSRETAGAVPLTECIES